jgi:hypothetical protein
MGISLVLGFNFWPKSESLGLNNCNHSESRGISLVLGFNFWPKSESLGLNNCNHSESRGISLVLGFKFLPKSESLGLNGTQKTVLGLKKIVYIAVVFYTSFSSLFACHHIHFEAYHWIA